MGITGKVYSIDEVLSMLKFAGDMCSESLSLQWKAFKKKSSEQYGDPLCDGEYVSDAAIRISELRITRKGFGMRISSFFVLKGIC